MQDFTTSCSFVVKLFDVAGAASLCANIKTSR